MEIRKSFPDKKEIRKKHLAIRNAMSEPEKEEKSRKICEKLINSNWYTITDWIFGYYPLGKEADCLTFLRQALHDGKHVALPRTEQTVPWNFTRSHLSHRHQRVHFMSWNQLWNAAV